MLNPRRLAMRPLHRMLRQALSCTAMLAMATPARAQDPSAAEVTPSACVAAAGPELGAPVDSAPRAMRPAAARPDPGQNPTVRLFAAVEAQEVRFERSPRICVKLRGDVRLDSVRVVGRRNLASPVVAGTTYRNVYVAVEILGHLDAECIAARITGETPRTAAGACAALQARDSTAAPQAGTTPPAGPSRR